MIEILKKLLPDFAYKSGWMGEFTVQITDKLKQYGHADGESARSFGNKRWLLVLIQSSGLHGWAWCGYTFELKGFDWFFIGRFVIAESGLNKDRVIHQLEEINELVRNR